MSDHRSDLLNIWGQTRRKEIKYIGYVLNHWSVDKDMAYDVIIIGAGPAGLFASYEVSAKDVKVLIVEKGKDLDERTPKDVMSGVGGAGTFSDGTVNLRPDVGGNLCDYTKIDQDAWELVNYVSDILSSHGMPEPKKNDAHKEEELKRRAASVGGRFFPIVQSHIGSDKAPELIRSFKKELLERNVEFSVGTEVSSLLMENGECKGVVISDGKEIRSKKTLLAPGRVGMEWVQKLTEDHVLKADFAPIDIGVRVEVPCIIMDPITEVNRDPKFHLYTPTYNDFIRTFCCNQRGSVIKESYNGFIGVNGHSKKLTETENTNFAFLIRTHLTKPQEDTTKYGRSIAQLATTIGGGKPIVQRMGDLLDGRRSTESRLERNPVQGTLTDVTPGDISMALPHRSVVDIIEGLQMLDKIIPGVNSTSTLLYAPEIKFYAKRLKIDENLQTSIPNLYAAGDGAGLSHDIMNAAATGIIAGRSMRDALGVLRFGLGK